MAACSIDFENVNMSYPSAVYNAGSIKESLFRLARHDRQKKLIKDVHALRDFTLRIKEGDRVGVIGHNGAGKSTLLKTIAGIYPIDSGSINVQGKVRALFDISLGFDLESTGRENILYRGLLLGASPAEMREKMDEIVAFTDIGDFIDYPVKTYSTGMAVRLAFSISTCIEGEILLLDEILGAGDAAFQVKAQKRIYELIDNARIMVFVTHNMNALQELCNRAVLMEHGKIRLDSTPQDVINQYNHQ